MKKYLQKICISLIFLFVFVTKQTFSYGVQDSLNLYSFLTNNNFITEYQELISEQESLFPKNVIVTIPSTQEKQKSFNVIFAFTQEFVIKDTEAILYFLNSIKEAKLPYTTKVLLSADYINSELPKDTKHLHPTGTEAFTNFGETNIMCSIVVIESSTNQNNKVHSIIPGGAKEVSPLWLVKTLQNACQSKKQIAHIPKTVAFLYRLGLTEENKRVSAFLEQEIPAAGISINNCKEDYDILLSVALNLVKQKNLKWDRHYSYVQVPFLNYSFWVNEALYTTNYLLITCIILFLLCFYSFSNTNKNNAVFYDLKKTWYLTPFFIVATTTVLVLSQYFLLRIPQTNKIFSENPIFLLGAKLFASFLFSLIFFALQAKFNFKTSFQASSYLMMCMSTINIFLFCSIDLTLLFMFFFEYCICYFAHKAQKPFYIAITLLFLFIPFVMPAMNIIHSVNAPSLKEFAYCSYFGNFLCACIIYPLQIQWKRLLVSTGIFNKKIVFKKKQVLYSILFILLSVSIFASAYILFSGFVTATGFFDGKKYAKFFELQKKSHEQNIILPTQNLQCRTKVSVLSEPFMELNINRINVDFLQTDGSYVLRQEIYVESENGTPVYESNYTYQFEGENKISFKIPDYPAQNFSIVFSCMASTKNIITVTTWIKNSNGTVVKESQKVFS